MLEQQKIINCDFLIDFSCFSIVKISCFYRFVFKGVFQLFFQQLKLVVFVDLYFKGVFVFNFFTSISRFVFQRCFLIGKFLLKLAVFVDLCLKVSCWDEMECKKLIKIVKNIRICSRQPHIQLLTCIESFRVFSCFMSAKYDSHKSYRYEVPVNYNLRKLLRNQSSTKLNSSEK